MNTSLMRRTLLCLAAALGFYAAAFAGEQPTGAIRGQVTGEASKPLGGVTVQVRLLAPGKQALVRTAEAGEDGAYLIDRLPVGAYEVNTLAVNHVNKPHSTLVREGAAGEVDLALKPGPPFLSLYVHEHVRRPGADGRVAVRGFRQGKTLNMALYRVDDRRLIEQHSANLHSMLDPVPRTRQNRFAAAARDGRIEKLRSWTHRLTQHDAEGEFYEFIATGKLSAGIFLITAEGGQTTSEEWLLVTDLAAIARSEPGRVHAWITDLQTGEPQAGVEIAAYGGGKSLFKGRSSAQGLAEIDIHAPHDSLLLTARHGQNLALVNLWQVGPSSHPPLTSSLLTDRPVYRPGDTVQFKLVSRRLLDGRYRIPREETVRVSIQDPIDSLLHVFHLHRDSWGAVHGQFVIPKAAQTGAYRINASASGEQEESFYVTVAAYRKPEWQVEVRSLREEIVQGEPLIVDVAATYYHDAPVSHASASYSLFRTPEYGWAGDEDDEQSQTLEEGWWGDLIDEGRFRLDAAGKGRLDLETATAALEGGRRYRYTVQVDVEDVSGRTVEGRARVTVLPAALDLNVDAGRYVAAPGEPVQLTLRSRDLEGVPSAATGGLIVDVEEWTPAGARSRRLLTENVTTGPDGALSRSVVSPIAGALTARFSASDAAGRRTEATADVWIYEGAGSALPARDALDLTLDRKSYEPGDEVEVLVRSAAPELQVLISLDGDRIYDQRLVRLTGGSALVRFPVSRVHAPNVFVTAHAVRAAEHLTAERIVRLADTETELTLKIEPERSNYEPGETARFTVRTTDARGLPVPADCAFSLVEEAIYSIAPDAANQFKSAFYPRRANRVQTLFSSPVLYLGDASKAGEVQLRRDLRDTAFWDPVLRTGSDGTALVQVKLPENLTTWRATVKALSAESAAGQTTAKVVATRPLVVRLQIPRGMTVRDSLDLGTVVQNNSPRPQRVEVGLTAAGLEPGDGGSRRVDLAPGASRQMSWRMTAARPGIAVITAWARGADESDGVELTLPVRQHAVQEVRYESGVLLGPRTEKDVELGQALVRGELEVRLSTSLLGPMLAAGEYLISYPYGCVEQTMSSFFPDLIVEDLLRRRDSSSGRFPELPEMIRQGLLRIYALQSPDGGWGWWEHDGDDPWMTSYVLLGLQAAASRGHRVNQRVFSQASEHLARLSESMPSKPKMGSDSSAAFVAYVLTELGQRGHARSLIARCYPPGQEPVGISELGYLALTMAGLNDAASLQRAQVLAADLWERARTDPSGIHWTEPAGKHRWLLPEPAETTAVALLALTRLDPGDERLAAVARWLVGARRGKAWASTRDTAWVLLALAEYAESTGELSEGPPPRLISYRHIIPLEPSDDGHSDEWIARMPLPAGRLAAPIEIINGGRGPVYWTLTITAHEVREPLMAAPLPKVLSVERSYYRSRGGAPARAAGTAMAPAVGVARADQLTVRLVLQTEVTTGYLMISDPLPAGFEVLDRGELSRWEWSYWWSSQEIRDDRIIFFVDRLPPGRHVLEYIVRPEHTGRVAALPATVEDMYHPAVRARSGSQRIEVRQ